MAQDNRQPARSKSAPRRTGGRRLWATVLDIFLFAAALWVLHHVLTQYSYQQVLAATGQIGWLAILASVALTVLGYAALVGYDFLSLHLVRCPLPLKRMWSASFISFAVSNSAPIAVVTGGGIRLRLFSGLGLSPVEAAAVSAGNILTYILGLFTVAGIAFIVRPVHLPMHLPLGITSLRPVGALFLVLVAAVLIAGSLRLGTIGIGRWRFGIPPLPTLLAQLSVSAADWLLSSGALYVLIRAATPADYLPFLATFLLAQIVTQVVPLPGGIGVFEAVILLLRPPGAQAPALTGALLLYRVIYYLLPLLAASALLVLRARSKGEEGVLGGPVRDVARVVAPHLFAVMTFLAGAVLLFFGALPANPTRLAWLGRLLPAVVIVGSHFVGSIIGTGLILLAWGLERRLRVAWRLTVALVALGIPTALLRGLDFPAAGFLLLFLLILAPARDVFRRRSALIGEPATPGWITAMALALGSIVWLGLFAHQHAEFADQPWWRFTLSPGGPRPLRVGVGVMVPLLILAMVRLFRVARRRRGRKH